MKSKLEEAKRFLEDGGYTCVLIQQEKIFQSQKRGVQPLLELLDTDPHWEGAVAADRVVGKAAAFLYVLLQVKAVWAGVISEPAKAVFQEAGIFCAAEQTVPAIRNRANTGFCPMESAVKEMRDPWIAREVLKETMRRLQTQKNE